MTEYHNANYKISHNAEGSPSAVSNTVSEHAAQFTVVRGTGSLMLLWITKAGFERSNNGGCRTTWARCDEILTKVCEQKPSSSSYLGRRSGEGRSYS